METFETLPILVEGDDRLRGRSAPVEAVDAEARRHIGQAAASLAAFRRAHGFGRALAAPQIGISRRLIVLDLGAGPLAVMNPEILWRSDETFELWDDCFSVPDRLVRVRRNRSISLSYRDDRFRLRRWERLPAELAELLQHEIDHLDGILMTDRTVGPDAVVPARERARLVDAVRPQRRLSLVRIAEAARRIAPELRDSPQFLSEPLSDALGCALTLKVETVNPIRSFKGRGADYFVSRLSGAGRLVCASAGNFGQALAYACRPRGIPLVVYGAETANPLKVQRMRALGAEVRLEGPDFDTAKRAAERYAAESGATMVVDGLLPEISEGAGTIGVELLARGDAFDAVLVPLGDGALISGIARWIKAAAPATQVVGICSRGAPAVAESFRNGPGGAIVAHAETATIADGIAVSTPIPEAVADMHGVVDDVVLVDDEQLVAALRLLHRHAGLVVEPAGAPAIAALLADPARFAGRSVAAVISGGNVTPEQMAAWL